MSQPKEATELMAELRETYPQASGDELQERYAEEINEMIDYAL